MHSFVKMFSKIAKWLCFNFYHETIEKRDKQCKESGFQHSKISKFFDFKGRCPLTPTKHFEVFDLYKKSLLVIFL